YRYGKLRNAQAKAAAYLGNNPDAFGSGHVAWVTDDGGRRDAMQKKRRNSSASPKRPIEEEIAHLRDLDLKGLRSRWQSVFGKQAPFHLTRHLLFAVIAYRLQADRFGDLDHATRQLLDRT